MQNLLSSSIHLFTFLVLFISCETKEYDLPDQPNQILSSTSEIENPDIFTGLTSITGVDDFSAVLNWTHSSDMGSYKVYDVTNGAAFLLGSVSAPNDTFQVIGLESGTSYTFKVLGQSSGDATNGRFANNDSEITITTATEPSAPLSVTKIFPHQSEIISAVKKPSFFLSGLRVGDELKLYKDACLTEIASKTVDDTYTILQSEVAVNLGLNLFYTKVTNPNGVSSSCTYSGSYYTYQTCPVGYVPVPADADLGTTEFCVMKYEAKAWSDTSNDGVVDFGEVDADGCNENSCTTVNWGTSGFKPGSGGFGTPWRMLDSNTAKSECKSLGDHYI